jgi:hypothetical protein
MTAINEHVKTNFETMLRAAADGNLACVASRRVSDGADVNLVCAISRDEDGSFVIAPFAEMIAGNPYELYADPSAE